jgi:hypothetical protein
MGKIIVGVVAGFIVWTVLWLGSHAIIVGVAPALAPAEDLSNIPPAYLVIKLVLSFIFSIASGYVAATLARENSRAPLFLGILLLLVGIMFQAAAWNQIPLWYHIPFLLLLLPMAVLGGKIRKT